MTRKNVSKDESVSGEGASSPEKAPERWAAAGSKEGARKGGGGGGEKNGSIRKKRGGFERCEAADLLVGDEGWEKDVPCRQPGREKKGSRGGNRNDK